MPTLAEALLPMHAQEVAATVVPEGLVPVGPDS